jgi:hypothetical protein
MKLTKVHLFVMLLLALVLCSFLGGACGDSLEGFNMPSDTSPYRGKGQYSDQFSNYGDMYSANKQQDDTDDSKFASFAGSSAAGSSAAGSSAAGIPANQIIPGQEDLYILKSTVVPPVCPACPAVRCNNNSNGKNSTPAKCPPCPPCARCPEPSFECKKVPNYSLSNNNALPRPVLSSFSQFGL